MGNLLITGEAGFIGFTMTNKTLGYECEIRNYDNLSADSDTTVEKLNSFSKGN